MYIFMCLSIHLSVCVRVCVRVCVCPCVCVDATSERDIIMDDEGPVALVLRAMESDDTADNTSDFALDSGLWVGQDSRNAVFEPAPVALDIADRIEEMDTSPLTRQRLSVCLPVVSLADRANQRAFYERLCLVYMDGLLMPHVWLVALSAMLRALEREDWATPESVTGRALAFMANEIMTHVFLAEGTRLSPDRRETIRNALAATLNTDILTVHASVSEVAVVLRLLERFGADAPVTRDALVRNMQARVNTAIPQVTYFLLLFLLV